MRNEVSRVDFSNIESKEIVEESVWVISELEKLDQKVIEIVNKCKHIYNFHDVRESIEEKIKDLKCDIADEIIGEMDEED